MEIDNFEVINNLLTFESEDDFYYLQILMRKKDFEDHDKANRNSARCLKTYYIKSKEYLLSKKNEIIELCKTFKARAYINLNRKSFKKSALYTLRSISDKIIFEQYEHVFRSYDSVIGKSEVNNGPKRWVLDIDSKNYYEIMIVIMKVNKCKSKFEKEGYFENVIDIIETPNGFHLITNPFNLKQLEPFMATYYFDIQKNNPTLLYYYKK